MNRIAYCDSENLPNISAVYVIRNESEVLYVGSTWTLKQRIKAHHKKEAFALMNANLIEWIEVSNEDIKSIEQNLIRALMPKLNMLASRKSIEFKKSSAKKKEDQFEMPLEVIAILNNTIEMLQVCIANKPIEKTLADIGEKTDVSISWLKLLLRNKVGDPGIGRITRLHNFLKNYKA